MLCWCQVAQLCLTLCDAMDCSPPGSSVHGTLQARIQEWVAISFSRAFSWPRDWTCIFYVPSIGLAPPGKPSLLLSSVQFSPVMSNSLQPHGLQHTRLLCPTPSPRVCSNSCPLSQWCHPTISSSVTPSPPALSLSQHLSPSIHDYWKNPSFDQTTSVRKLVTIFQLHPTPSLVLGGT